MIKTRAYLYIHSIAVFRPVVIVWSFPRKRASFTDQPNYHINCLLCPHFGLQGVARKFQHVPEHTHTTLSVQVVCELLERICFNTHTWLCTTLLFSALAGTCGCAQGWVIRATLELYKKSLTVKTIVQTPWFQRCSTTACAARADWTRALERGRETSGSQHPVAVHLPLSLLLASLSFVSRKGFEHQRTVMLPWRQ